MNSRYEMAVTLSASEASRELTKVKPTLRDVLAPSIAGRSRLCVSPTLLPVAPPGLKAGGAEYTVWT